LNILLFPKDKIFLYKNWKNQIMEQPILNDHNKQEYPPMHTAEHILNATMVKMFGCPRSRNAHIERKKSKCDYILEQDPSPEQVAAIEAKVNEVIALNLPVTIEFMSKQEAAQIVDLSKLPDDASQTLRIVRIGEYDACACIGAHVETTSEIGTFKIISHSFENGVWRLRWKVTAS
jgi:alanyl-tRNA synthetase